MSSFPARIGLADFPPHLQNIHHAVHQEKETVIMAQQHTTPASTSNLLNQIDQEIAANTDQNLGNAVVATEQSREEQIHTLAVRVVDHEEQAKKHTAEAKAAKEHLAVLVGHGKHESGNLTISVAKKASSFDKKAFEESYPVEVNPGLYAETLDTSAIPPKLKNQFMVPGEGFGTITVK